MDPLIECRSVKAARILDASRTLVLDHGIGKVTVSEITRAAGVGKGTVYVFWPSKEALILGMFARDLLAAVDAVIQHLSQDASQVLPARLAPFMIRTAQGLPLSRFLNGDDAQLPHLLAAFPEQGRLFSRISPSAMCGAIIPILARHGLVSQHRSLSEYAFMMHALLTGFGHAITHAATSPAVDDPYAVFAHTVEKLFAPEALPSTAVLEKACAEVVSLFTESRGAVLDVIRSTQVTTS
ncbi:TetR/AcrR family transcriptional regulator [Streptomyces sp. NPDC090106]|uniref:TetR/AcrR family transcriptional regulator n=1 Tax=Streptomyces sp. NPDC090106 TaxID=3365946 RepID=UPI003820FE88